MEVEVGVKIKWADPRWDEEDRVEVTLARDGVPSTNTFSLELLKYCFKPKRTQMESSKNTTFSFAQYFNQGVNPPGGNSKLNITNFLTKTKPPVDDEVYNARRDIFLADGIEDVAESKIDLQGFYKTFIEVHGISAATLRKAISKQVIGQLISSTEECPNKEKYINALCKGSNSRTNIRNLRILNKNLDVVERLEQDNLVNIIPFIMWINSFNTVDDFRAEPTKFLKKHFGKSEWKRIVKQSFTRNAIIVKRFGSFSHYNGHFNKDQWPITLIKYSSSAAATLNQRFHAISTRLSNPNIQGYEKRRARVKKSMDEFIKGYKISDRVGRQTLLRDLNMINDTLGVYDRNPRLDFGVQWDHRTNFNAILATHDHIMEVYRQANPYTGGGENNLPADFSWLEKCFTLSGEVGGNPYKVLSSDHEIVKEGVDMDHCVGVYSRRTGQGRYVVAHIGEEAPRGITLGCTISAGKVCFQQAYGWGNKILSTKDNHIAKSLVRVLDKEYQAYVERLKKEKGSLQEPDRQEKEEAVELFALD